MNKNSVLKKTVSLAMVISLIVSCIVVSSASEVNDTDCDDSGDEIVTYIVSLKQDALLEDDEAEEMGTDFLLTDEASEEKDKLLTVQEKVQNQILSKIDPDAVFGYSYTAVINGFSVTAKKSDKSAILRLGNVESVTLSVSHASVLENEQDGSSSGVSYTADGNNKCCDVQYIDALRDAGFTGEGMVVAVIDNEFQYDHENFETAPASPRLSKSDVKNIIDSGALSYKGSVNSVYISEKVPFVYNYELNSPDTRSMTGCHGTHVAGIIAGNHVDENGDTTGVAPDAQIIGMTTENIETEYILAAFEDACALGVDVINCSWGSPYAHDDCLDEVTSNVVSSGIIITCAAGNSASDFNGYGDVYPQLVEYSTGGSPQDCSGVFSVASASYKNSDVSASYYTSSCTGGSLELKPDIMSVGGNVYSSISSRKDAYKSMSGTSMASPHMAGILAIMCQYLKENYDLSSSDLNLYCKDLIMSTATVTRDDDTDIAVTPRIQGAGLADVSDAVNASAFFEGDNGLSKLSLYDNLSDTFDLTFSLKNITDKDVTYTGVSIETLTDGTEDDDGVISVEGSVSLDSSATVLPESITVPAGSEITVTIPVVLDKEQLEKNAETFTNGFYIDGYVYLTGADDGSADINMPFMGFYGDWNSAKLFDEPVFSGNSVTECTYMGYGNSYEEYVCDFDDSGYIVLNVEKLGFFYDEEGNEYLSGEQYVAFSPNGDEIRDTLIPVVLPLRDSDYIRYDVIDSSGEVIMSGTSVANGEKFYPNFTVIYSDYFETVPDGVYTMEISGRHSYKNAEEESVTMQFTVDRVAPVIDIKDVNADDITAVSVPVRDGYNISVVTFSDGENIKNIYWDGSSAFNDTVDLTGFDLSETDVTAEDCAGNSTTNKLICDHSYIDTVDDPTCTEPGSLTRYCTICGYGYTEEIPALGHIDGNGDGVCDNCSEILDVEKHNQYIVDNAVISVPSSSEIRWKFRAKMTASVTELPEGYHIVWYDGDTLVSDSADLTTGSLKSAHTYTAKIADGNGNIVSADAQNKSVTVSVKSDFFTKIISFVLRLFNDVTVLR